jgi:hypothetical protein
LKFDDRRAQDTAKGGGRRLCGTFRHLAESSPVRISDPWLSCSQQAKPLIDTIAPDLFATSGMIVCHHVAFPVRGGIPTTSTLPSRVPQCAASRIEARLRTCSSQILYERESLSVSVYCCFCVVPRHGSWTGRRQRVSARASLNSAPVCLFSREKAHNSRGCFALSAFRAAAQAAPTCSLNQPIPLEWRSSFTRCCPIAPENKRPS